MRDGGYDSPHNAAITWKHHLQQESEWEGAMWGKQHDFVGAAAFGAGERKPRALQQPGAFYEYNDVRINRLALSLLRVFEQAGAGRVPGRSHGPDRRVERVEMGAVPQQLRRHRRQADGVGQRRYAWGGGMWINSGDMARFGYLWLRGGKWGGKQIVPPAFVKAALAPSAHGPDYGYLWWLNTKGKNFPGLPANAYGALGAGSNTITVSPTMTWSWFGAGMLATPPNSRAA